MDNDNNDLKKNNFKAKLISVVKKIGGFFIIILLMGLGQTFGKMFTAANNNSNSIENNLKNFAEDINKELPIMIDSETQLVNVVSFKESITMHYKIISYILDEIDVYEMRDMLSTNILNNFCSNPDFEIFRENNIAFKYTYHDRVNTYITSFNFNNSDCR